jgi:hypothetical protein
MSRPDLLRAQIVDMIDEVEEYIAPKSSKENMDGYELTSIRALVFYAAQRNGIREETMEAILLEHFAQAAIADIPRIYFAEMVTYLIDFRNSIN